MEIKEYFLSRWMSYQHQGAKGNMDTTLEEEIDPYEEEAEKLH